MTTTLKVTYSKILYINKNQKAWETRTLPIVLSFSHFFSRIQGGNCGYSGDLQKLS